MNLGHHEISQPKRKRERRREKEISQYNLRSTYPLSTCSLGAVVAVMK